MARDRAAEVRYASGMFGTSLPINMFVTYMGFYYVEELEVLDAAQLAGVFVLYAIIDAVDNPVYGYLSDRTRSRWGRRRPWLVIGAPLLAVCLVAFFSPPDSLGALGYVVWFALFAILTQTIDSLLNTNYGALLPELFVDEQRRARVNALRQGLQLVAIVVGVALTPVITQAIGFPATAAVYGGLAAAVIIAMALGVRENPTRLVSRPPRILESVRSILGTREFWAIAVTNGTYASAISLLLAGTPFFVTHVLGLDQLYTSVLLASVILASIGFLAIWTRVVAHHGALAVWRTSLAVLAVSFVPMYAATTLPVAIVAGCLIGAGYSGVIATADVVVARFIDADAARSGVHREAMVISAFGFFNRLSSLAKSLGFFGMFAIYGYVNGAAPGDRPDDAARFLMLVLPCALVTVAAVVSRFVRQPGVERPAHAGAVVVGAQDGDRPAGA